MSRAAVGVLDPRSGRAAHHSHRAPRTDAAASASASGAADLPDAFRRHAGARHLRRRHRADVARHPAGARIPHRALHHLDRDAKRGAAHARQARDRMQRQIPGRHPRHRRPRLLAGRRHHVDVRAHARRMARAAQLRGELQGPGNLLVRVSGRRSRPQSARERRGHERRSNLRDADRRGTETVPVRQCVESAAHLLGVDVSGDAGRLERHPVARRQRRACPDLDARERRRARDDGAHLRLESVAHPRSRACPRTCGVGHEGDLPGRVPRLLAAADRRHSHRRRHLRRRPRLPDERRRSQRDAPVAGRAAVAAGQLGLPPRLGVQRLRFRPGRSADGGGEAVQQRVQLGQPHLGSHQSRRDELRGRVRRIRQERQVCEEPGLGQLHDAEPGLSRNLGIDESRGAVGRLGRRHPVPGERHLASGMGQPGAEHRHLQQRPAGHLLHSPQAYQPFL